jgi:hypothetical protein
LLGNRWIENFSYRVDNIRILNRHKNRASEILVALFE